LIDHIRSKNYSQKLTINHPANGEWSERNAQEKKQLKAQKNHLT